MRGDRFLLCSDGLTNELDVDQITEVLSSVSDPHQAAELLVQAARTHGGSDNITVVVVDVVVGDDDDSVPAVAAVNADFAPVAAGGRHAAAERARPPTPPRSTETQPGRRERRKAKRRERRIARGRRLITFRTLLFLILFAAVLAGAFFAVRWYDTNSYFVGVDNNELVIYQGRIGRLPLVPPGGGGAHRRHHRRRSRHLPRRPQRRGGGDSVASARSYVTNLVNHEELPERPDVGPVAPVSPHLVVDHAPTAAAPSTTAAPARPRRGRPDGTADPAARDLHGAVLRGPVPPAQQHPGPQGQLAGQQPEQPPGPGRPAQPAPGRHPLRRRRRSGPSGPEQQRLQVPAGLRPYTATLFSQIVGFDSPSTGTDRASRPSTTRYLKSHTRPAKTLRDLLVNRTDHDNVTLTIGTKLQSSGGRGSWTPPTAHGAGPGGGGRGPQPEDRRHRGHVLQSNLRPESAWSSQNSAVEQRPTAGPPRTRASHRSPLVSRDLPVGLPRPAPPSRRSPPSAVYDHQPALAKVIYPRGRPHPLPAPRNPPSCCNYALGTEECGGTLAAALPASCNTAFAQMGMALGTPALTTEAQAFGFNQQHPLDLPGVGVSYFPTDSRRPTLNDAPLQAWTRPSARRTSTPPPCRWRWWPGGSPTGA